MAAVAADDVDSQETLLSGGADADASVLVPVGASSRSWKTEPASAGHARQTTMTNALTTFMLQTRQKRTPMTKRPIGLKNLDAIDILSISEHLRQSKHAVQLARKFFVRRFVISLEKSSCDNNSDKTQHRRIYLKLKFCAHLLEFLRRQKDQVRLSCAGCCARC